MKSSLLTVLTMVAVSLLFGNIAKADTVDATTGVTYNLTASTDGSDGAGTMDLTLTVNTSTANFTSGFLTAVAMQFTGASSVTLESAPGGVSNWTMTSGGLNASGCNTSGNFVCFQDSASNPLAVGGTYTFTFDVTGWTCCSSDVKADFNSSADNSGTNLGLTSMGITATPVSTPEPSSLAMLGFGLIGLAGFARRRFNA